MGRQQVYSSELKWRQMERVVADEEVSAVASEEGVDRKRLYDWVAIFRRDGPKGLGGPGRQMKEEALRPVPRGPLMDRGTASPWRLAELERKVAQQELDLDFFRQALRHVKARQQEATGVAG
jgi:transposase